MWSEFLTYVLWILFSIASIWIVGLWCWRTITMKAPFPILICRSRGDEKRQRFMARSTDQPSLFIELADSDEAVLSAYDAMRYLHDLPDASSFLRRVRELQHDGYHLVRVVAEGRVVTAAGFRLGDKIPWGPLSVCRRSCYRADAAVQRGG